MSFEDLLSDIYGLLARARVETFENVFIDSQITTKHLYERTGLSGATFVVADNKLGRFVLLQKGVPEADDYKVKLQLPIRNASNPSEPITNSVHSLFCNRIFQLQRKSQGLGGFQKRLQLPSTPDFLCGLHSGLGPADPVSDDWLYVTATEVFEGLLAWRWLHWLIAEYGSDFKINEVNPSDAWSRRDGWTPNFERYFDNKHLSSFDLSNADNLPEHFIAALDFDPNWESVGPKAGQKWISLREQLDGAVLLELDFSGEYDRLSRIYNYNEDEALHVEARLVKGIDTVANVHRRILNNFNDPSKTLEQALVQLHVEANFPLPAYYYFSIVEQAAKEHLVVPVFRSATSPLVYFVNGERKSHTAVVFGLASLNALRATEVVKRMRILELKTILRICADRIIDEIFIKGIVEAEREQSKQKGCNVLATCRAKKDDKIIVLGSFGKRVTFLAQQSRALLIVRALDEEGRLRAVRETPEQRVAIVGGGLAGMTAAAALATVGVRVTLFEAEPALLSLQAGATHRFLHPNMSTWPASSSMLDTANLPIMSWKAEAAPAVANKLRIEFDTIKRESELIEVYTNTLVTEVDPVKGGVMVFGSGAVKTGELFPLVIVAIGFGLERNVPQGNSATPSYWEPDSLEEVKLKKRDVLVIGDGDGGLIDLARASLNSLNADGERIPFNQEAIARELIRTGPFEDLANGLKMADKRFIESGERSTLIKLYRAAFLSLTQGGQIQLRNMICSIKREDMNVTYGFTHQNVFRTDTALINRVLAFLIIETNCAQPVYVGTVEKIEIDENGKYQVLYGDGKSRTFDFVTARLGTDGGWLVNQIGGLRRIHEGLSVLGKLEIADELDADTFKWYADQMRSKSLGHSKPL